MNPFTKAEIVAVDVDPKVYHADEGAPVGNPDHVFTRSESVAVLQCPAKYKAGAEDSEETESTEWGTWLDNVILAQSHMGERMAVKPETYPDTKTGEPKPWSGNSTWCKTWLKEHEDKITLKRTDLDEVGKAATRVLQDDRLLDLIKCSRKQVWVKGEYQDKATGLVVPVKALVDLAPDVSHPVYGKCLADLKTCRSASPRPFARQIFQFGWHVQAAWYLDLWTAATGEDRCEWRFVLSENQPPYQPGRRLLSSEYLEIGRLEYLRGLKLYCQCLKTGVWPSWDDGANTLDGWSLSEPEDWMLLAAQGEQFQPVYEDPSWIKDEEKEEGPVTP